MKKHHHPSAHRGSNSPGVHAAAGLSSAPASLPRPVSNLTKHQENIDVLLKAGPAQIPAHSMSPSAGEASAGSPGGPAPRPPAKTRVSFMLQRPARSVKIAGDFTGWEKSPVDMISSGDDRWSAIIPLPPGQYAYRFIVDGQWCEDPQCRRHAPNGFGSENSVVEVR